MLTIQSRILSSMEKVFPSEAPKALSHPLTALQGERVSFQLALSPEPMPGYFTSLPVEVDVETDLAVSVSEVGYVPVLLPYFNNSDGRYLKDEPGLFPDPLYPLEKADEPMLQDSANASFTAKLLTGRWNSLFFEVDTAGCTPGQHEIKVQITPTGLYAEAYEPVCQTVSVTVAKTAMPASDLVYTAWFHGDCLADYYHVPVFSEAHWQIMQAQIETAVRYGQSMILVPLFTPPLDTAVGGERTTIQTVQVCVDDAGYHFDFTLFDRFIRMAQDAGIRYLEMSHLFTQWGGKACPKIMGVADGELRQLFGWDHASDSPEYTAFLQAFLPALVSHLDDLGLRGRVYFHLTDEPHADHLEQYLKLKNIVEPLLSGYPIMDAMSDYNYFTRGVSKLPVVATDALEPFLAGERPEEFWVYYCCSEGHHCLSNRFIDMPGYRTRILGIQMFMENVRGFLQWGLNFYNSQYSIRHINPFETTDADGAFPAGDPFVLYPGADGKPILSQRLIIFHEAIQDLTVLRLLEKKKGREFAVSLIERLAAQPVTFTDYPVGEDFQLRLAEAVRKALGEA